MKKILALCLALAMAMSLVACGGETEETTAATEAAETTAAAEEETTAAAEAEETTAAAGESAEPTTDNPVVNLNGEFDKANVKGSVLVTSVGQSSDTEMIGTLLTKAGATYELNASATAADVSAYGTVLVVAGASTKGLGAAGISIDDELARATELLDACDAAGITVIMAHIGGSARRGSMSDQFTDLVMAHAKYMIVVAEGNTDGYFTDFCAAGNIPLTLCLNTKSVLTPLQNLFA